MKRFIVVVAMLVAAGCGGGGGSSTGSTGSSLPASYTGNTAPATVSSSNAKSLAVSAYSGVQVALSMSTVGKAVPGENSSQDNILGEVIGSIENSLTTVAEGKSLAKTVAAAASYSNTYNGYSGSYTINISLDNVSGATTGTIAYNQFKASASSAVMSGTVTINGIINLNTGLFTSYNMQLSNISLAGTGLNVVFSGSLGLSSSGTSKTYSATFAVTDSTLNSTTVLKDYSVTINGTSLTLSGTYYNPIHGYLTMSTVTPLTVATLSSSPTAGQLLFTGGNGSKARITFSSTGYSVSVYDATTGAYVNAP
jgi:hypothetical protein